MTALGEQRVITPAHATGSVEFVALEEIALDETFRLRPDGDVSELATSLGRLGQLAPIELRPWPGAASDGARWQVVSGFRRLAAVRLLARERVLARLHSDLADDDAWGLALGEALLREPLTGDELTALRERLEAEGIASWAEPLIDDALVRAPVPPALREQFFEFLSGSFSESLGQGVRPRGEGAEDGADLSGDAESASDADAELLRQAAIEASRASAVAEIAEAGAARSLAAAPHPGGEVAEAADPPRAEAEQPGAPETVAPVSMASSSAASSLEAARGDASLRPGVEGEGEGEGGALGQTARGKEKEEAALEIAAASGNAEDLTTIEMTPEELVSDLVGRLSDLNQDLATAVEAWDDLPPGGRQLLLEQARYVAQLLPFMETKE